MLRTLLIATGLASLLLGCTASEPQRIRPVRKRIITLEASIATSDSNTNTQDSDFTSSFSSIYRKEYEDAAKEGGDLPDSSVYVDSDDVKFDGNVRNRLGEVRQLYPGWTFVPRKEKGIMVGCKIRLGDGSADDVSKVMRAVHYAASGDQSYLRE